MLPLVAVLSMSPLAASNTVILVDNSGSVAGMSSIRPHNSIRMITGELTDYLSKMEAEDTVSILRFTDRIFVSQTFAGYSDKLQSAVDSLKFVPQGNTDISSALAAVYNIETFQRVIIITDGLNNVGKSDTDICDELQSLALNVKGELYCLLLNEDDMSNAILTYADKSDNIHLIRSLSEIPPFEQVLDVAPASETVVVPANAEVAGGTFDWKWVWIVLAILLAIALIALVCWLVYKYVSHSSSGTPLNPDLGGLTGKRVNSKNAKQSSQKEKKREKEEDELDEYLAERQSILLSSMSVNEKAVALYEAFQYYDYDLISDSEYRDKQFHLMSKQLQSAFDDLWDNFYIAPTSNGFWSGEEKNSVWIPDDSFVPKNKGYNNLDQKTWKQIKSENDFYGLRFEKGRALFEDVADKVVCINNFDELIDPRDSKNREKLHEEAFRLLSETMGSSVDDVRKYKEKNNLVWHEDHDCYTLYLVPREIHDNINHFGGIGMLKVLRDNHFVF